MIQIIIPAAGEGRRFREAGYDLPKPLIDVVGTPMLQRVIDNVTPTQASACLVLATQPLPGINADVLQIEPTGGAVETLLQAPISDGPLIIANCDQLVGWPQLSWKEAPNIEPMLYKTVTGNFDGCLATFRSTKAHHSYVKLTDGVITEIKEKKVISNRAVTGVYYFENGSDFYEAAKYVLDHDLKVKNEYYVSSVIQQLIGMGKRFCTYDAPAAMLGTPEELDLFLTARQVRI
jgi:bifunctional N-acetylglucosamine-1-phosphate-uridyltransferase/glucosamine-1-phosphate-acetyltransferase GlmU-like protein